LARLFQVVPPDGFFVLAEPRFSFLRDGHHKKSSSPPSLFTKAPSQLFVFQTLSFRFFFPNSHRAHGPFRFPSRRSLFFLSPITRDPNHDHDVSILWSLRRPPEQIAFNGPDFPDVHPAHISANLNSLLPLRSDPLLPSTDLLNPPFFYSKTPSTRRIWNSPNPKCALLPPWPLPGGGRPLSSPLSRTTV